MRKALLLIAVLPLVAGGCVAKTAFDIVTLPVKAAGQAADWATTSQDESDRNYGRKMRKQEAKDGRERKKQDKACRKNPDDCTLYSDDRTSDRRD